MKSEVVDSKSEIRNLKSEVAEFCFLSFFCVEFWLNQHASVCKMAKRCIGKQAESKPEKIARLQSLKARLPHVSQSALASLLAIAQREKLPEVKYRQEVRDARDLTVKITTLYGPLHQKIPVLTKSGTYVDVEIAHPFAMLQHVCKVSELFANCLVRTVAKVPNNLRDPWNLLVYTDEVTLGNQLAYRNARKFHTVAFSVVEFGPDILCHEQAWFTWTIVESTIVNEFQGGLAALFNAVLKSFFDPESHDIRSAGIRLVTPDGANLHLFFAHGFKLADESALHLALGCKGSGGIKICFLCQNIFNWRYRDRQIVENDATGWAQYHTCCDTNKLAPQTPASIDAIMTRLETAKATLRPEDFRELQRRVGWTYVKGSPLLDPHLKEIANPAKHAMYDTMHVYYVGVFSTSTRDSSWRGSRSTASPMQNCRHMWKFGIGLST